MSNIRDLLDAKVAYWTGELAGKTVAEIDKLVPPAGLLSNKAMTMVRAVRKREEDQAAAKVELVKLVPALALTNLDAVKLEAQADGSVVIRSKADLGIGV